MQQVHPYDWFVKLKRVKKNLPVVCFLSDVAVSWHKLKEFKDSLI